jgi:vacuolar-type H+-ATPase subunit C/Vma6
LFIFVRNNNLKTDMEKEQAIQILENQIYLAYISDNRHSYNKLKRVLTYLKEQDGN